VIDSFKMQITKIVFIISEIPYFPHTPQLLTDLQQFHLNKTRFFNQLGFFLLYFVYAAIDILSTQLGNPFLRKSGSNSISSQHGQGLSPAGGGQWCPAPPFEIGAPPFNVWPPVATYIQYCV